MLKILTYINTGALVIAVAGGGFAYFQRSKITDALLNKVQEQLPALVKSALPSTPKLPSNTGSVLPF
tara:strand:- start:379 stop:579 length:201 start_codon:yes stop_codon:yes gene_type:complete